jgi:hypothetical protein
LGKVRPLHAKPQRGLERGNAARPKNGACCIDSLFPPSAPTPVIIIIKKTFSISFICLQLIRFSERIEDWIYTTSVVLLFNKAARGIRLAIDGARRVKVQSSESNISVFLVPGIQWSSEIRKHINDAYSTLYPGWP